MPTTPARWRRAVVTGGAGFVGSHLCTALLDRGTRVVCVDDFSTGAPGNLAHLARRDGFTVLRADVCEPFEVDGRVDLVLHLASPASYADCLRLPLHTLGTASLGTRNALDLARAHRARFVLASAAGVYGDPQRHPQREDHPGSVDPVGPRSAHDEAKRFAEALTAAHAAALGTDAAIVRLFSTYGPRMPAHDGRAVAVLIRQALAGEPLTVTGDGSQTRSFTYVDDAVRGILALAASDLAGPVNIGSPHEISMNALARLVVSLTGSSSGVRHVARPAGDPAGRRPDTALARDKLQWEPLTGLREGLRRTVTWFRSVPRG
ncbi:NAD-dependent epimerase/dehydratase family protein [Streptomyces sp. NPDC001380]|uniref:NAD-dependent epimerase/dehydratase family protein n=1 Tax=Streptomyces sp. NPDC001380 TaxID=3364566 RepID=UPI00368E7939